METHFGMAHPTEKTKMEREEREKDREAATKMALAFSANFSQLTDGLAQVTGGLREQNQQGFETHFGKVHQHGDDDVLGKLKKLERENALLKMENHMLSHHANRVLENPVDEAAKNGKKSLLAMANIAAEPANERPLTGCSILKGLAYCLKGGKRGFCF